MALCRWSSSAWYIYEPCGSNWTLEICQFRQVSVVDIFRRYSEIEAQAKEERYGIVARLELRGYLKLWAYWKMKQISYRTYVRGLNFLRGLRQVQEYLQSPDDYKPFLGNQGDIPNFLQVEKVLCNKSLAKYEAEREERMKIKNSPLAKAMSEED